MMGTTYEIFEECLPDIDIWIKKAYESGYRRIILAGHSFGCTKKNTGGSPHIKVYRDEVRASK